MFEEFQIDFDLLSHIPWPEEHAPKRLYSDLTEQAIIGEELGFKAIWLAEHHFTRYGLDASSLVIASNIGGTPITSASAPPCSSRRCIIRCGWTRTRQLLTCSATVVWTSGFGPGAAASEYVNIGVDHAESQARYQETIEMVESL